MKHTHFYFLLCSLFIIASCSSSDKEEEGGQIMEYVDDVSYEEDESEAVEELEDEESQVEGTTVLAATIGTYQELAIMVLKWHPRDENGIYPIDGYYYYVTHQKNLDLEGYSEPSNRKIYLTESYKGKPSGYMEFIQDDETGEDSYWSPSKGSEDKQEFKCRDLLSGDPEEFTLAIQNSKYAYEHEVTMLTDEEYGTATNTLMVSILNDEFLAFSIDVIGTNAHIGSVSGVATIKGDKAIYDNGSTDEWDVCKLTFDLSKPNEITVIEDECTAYHGAYASFNCTFTKVK